MFVDFIRNCNVSNCQSLLIVFIALFHARKDTVELMAQDLCVGSVILKCVCVFAMV